MCLFGKSLDMMVCLFPKWAAVGDQQVKTSAPLGHASSFFQSCGIPQTVLEFLVLFDWPLGLGIQQSIASVLEFDGMNTNVVERHCHMTGCLYLYSWCYLLISCGSRNDHSAVHLFCSVAAFGSSIIVNLQPLIHNVTPSKQILCPKVLRCQWRPSVLLIVLLTKATKLDRNTNTLFCSSYPESPVGPRRISSSSLEISLAARFRISHTLRGRAIWEVAQLWLKCSPILL